MRGLALIGMILSSAPAHAQGPIDTSGIFVKKALAQRLTADELRSYEERLARHRAAGAFDRAPSGAAATRTPGDTCPAATYELIGPPWGPFPSTTAGALDNYDLPPDTTNPTCAAAVTCTGTGPAGSLPRGAVYTGTGTGPDNAWRIMTAGNCTLAIHMAPTGGQDLALVTYLAGCGSSLLDCACVSDSGLAGQAEDVSLEAVTGVEYFVVVDGYSTGGAPPGPAGPYELTITSPGGGCILVPVELQGFSIE